MANFLIIAASSDIGQCVVKILQEQGHNVFQTARNNNVISPDFILDASNFDDTEEAFKLAKEKFGYIDGVVNCAGSLFLKPAHLTSKEQLLDTINASLITSFSVVQASAKYMPEGGSVVLISSAAALTGLANHEAIATAKAGIIGLTLSAAATYAPINLRFNVVAPGLTETKLTTNLTTNESARKLSESMHALGRIGKPEDVARGIVFFLQPENNWVTGQVLGIDGGLGTLKVKVKA